MLWNPYLEGSVTYGCAIVDSESTASRVDEDLEKE
jgi:hypothetical protein